MCHVWLRYIHLSIYVCVHRVISHIGNGEFGSVARAYWKRRSGVVEVAVKSMPAEHTDTEDRVKLLQEAAMMGQFRHPNVVQLHGIVTDGTSVSYAVFSHVFWVPYGAMTGPVYVL